MVFDNTTAMTRLIGARHLVRSLVFCVDEDRKKLLEAMMTAAKALDEKQVPKDFTKKRPSYLWNFPGRSEFAYYDEVVAFLFEGFVDASDIGFTEKDREEYKYPGFVDHPSCRKWLASLYAAARAVAAAKAALAEVERLIPSFGSDSNAVSAQLTPFGVETVAELREAIDHLTELKDDAYRTAAITCEVNEFMLYNILEGRV